MEKFQRTEMLLGTSNVLKLKDKKVIVFGVGGVGGYVCEALVRSGIENLSIVDRDVVSESNINRQIIALESTIGLPKVEVMKKRLLDINKDCNIKAYEIFYLPETKEEIDLSTYDYVIDCVDTVTAKLLIIEEAKRYNIPVISAMGAGNKLDPTKFKISDISKTTVCPLARVMRYELRKRGIKNVKCCYSTEEPLNVNSRTPGSIAFVPSVCGLVIASEVIKDLINS